jgi:hypothetical protein
MAGGRPLAQIGWIKLAAVAPNNPPQHLGHANDGTSRVNVTSRVNRLLSVSFGERG